MSDKFRTLTVLLEEDMTAEEVVQIEAAVCMVKGVSDVERGSSVGGADHHARRAALMAHTRLSALLDRAAMFDERRYEQVRLILEGPS